jgi:hypothetical protein
MPQLEAVLDPRCHSLDPLGLQAAYIKLLKRAAGNEEYLRGRAIEGHTFNNQGGFALGLVREVLTSSLEMRAAFDNALGQQRQVMSQVHRKNENTELALQEGELLLEFIHRSNVPLEAKVKMRTMRIANNEVTIEAETMRWLAQHQRNGRGAMQVHAGPHHKRREGVEMALSWGFTGLEASDIPHFSAADTSARNDKAIHEHQRSFIARVLKGALPFIGWDEGSKRGDTACIGYLNATLEGADLVQWKREWAEIEPMVEARRKAGKGKAKIKAKAKAGALAKAGLGAMGGAGGRGRSGGCCRQRR